MSKQTEVDKSCDSLERVAKNIASQQCRLTWSSPAVPQLTFRQGPRVTWFVYDLNQVKGCLSCRLKFNHSVPIHKLHEDLKSIGVSIVPMDMTYTTIGFQLEESSPLYAELNRLGVFSNYYPCDLGIYGMY